MEWDLLEVDADEQVRAWSLCVGGEEYMLSPCCATLCRRADVACALDGWSCPTCVRAEAARATFACAFCERPFQRPGALVAATLRDDAGQWTEYGFCKAHARPWFAGEANAYMYGAAQVFAELQSGKTC
jgi:hypothetical protein